MIATCVVRSLIWTVTLPQSTQGRDPERFNLRDITNTLNRAATHTRRWKTIANLWEYVDRVIVREDAVWFCICVVFLLVAALSQQPVHDLIGINTLPQYLVVLPWSGRVEEIPCCKTYTRMVLAFCRIVPAFFTVGISFHLRCYKHRWPMCGVKHWGTMKP